MSDQTPASASAARGEAATEVRFGEAGRGQVTLLSHKDLEENAIRQLACSFDWRMVSVGGGEVPRTSNSSSKTKPGDAKRQHHLRWSS